MDTSFPSLCSPPSSAKYNSDPFETDNRVTSPSPTVSFLLCCNSEETLKRTKTG